MSAAKSLAMYCALLASAPAPIEPVKQAPTPRQLDEQTLGRLLEVRRVYVDRMGGGETAAHMRDMIIASLQQARLFLITDNIERADAVLKGSAEDLLFTDTFHSSEGLGARASVSTPTTGAGDRSSRRGYASVGLSDRESVRIAERKHEAVAAVWLVGKDGDVLWSTTQESLGAKFRGSSADVADKITRQFRADFERARKLRSTPDANPLAR